MDKIVIEGVRRYDGEYPLDLVDEPLTTLEWRWIKQISGYLPLTVDVGWTGRDPDLFLALACVAMVRADAIARDSVQRAASELENAPTAAIRVVADDEVEADADDQA